MGVILVDVFHNLDHIKLRHLIDIKGFEPNAADENKKIFKSREMKRYHHHNNAKVRPRKATRFDRRCNHRFNYRCDPISGGLLATRT